KARFNSGYDPFHPVGVLRWTFETLNAPRLRCPFKRSTPLDTRDDLQNCHKTAEHVDSDRSRRSSFSGASGSNPDRGVHLQENTRNSWVASCSSSVAVPSLPRLQGRALFFYRVFRFILPCQLPSSGGKLTN